MVLGIPAVGEVKKPDRKAKRERVFRFLPKFSETFVRQLHKYEFFSNISNVKVYFCQVPWIPCVSQACRDVFTGSLARSVQEV